MADEGAPAEEHNKYRDHLVDAKSTVTNVVNTWGEDGNPGQSIINHVTSGWQCDEADLWMDEVRTKALTIQGFFETAEADLAALVKAEPTDVHKGNWRGDAYTR
jgi:hypothetical protein